MTRIFSPLRGLACAAFGVALWDCTAAQGTGASQPSASPTRVPTVAATESAGCTPEYGRTSAELRRGERLRDGPPTSTRAELVVLITDGFSRSGAAAPEVVSNAIVEYRSAGLDEPPVRWLGRLRSDPRVRGRYASDSIPPATYVLRTRAIARKTLSYEVTLRPGWRDTLRVELAAASLCLGAPVAPSPLPAR